MAVDRMADAAAKRHNIRLWAHEDAEIRKKIAIAVQSHLVKSWFAWCAINSDADELTNEQATRLGMPTQMDLDQPAPECQGQFFNNWDLQNPGDEESGTAGEDPMAELDPSDELEHPSGLTDLNGNDPEYPSPPDYTDDQVRAERKLLVEQAIFRLEASGGRCSDDPEGDVKFLANILNKIDKGADVQRRRQQIQSFADSPPISNADHTPQVPGTTDALQAQEPHHDEAHHVADTVAAETSASQNPSTHVQQDHQQHLQKSVHPQQRLVSTFGGNPGVPSGGTPRRHLAEDVRGGTGLPADEVPTEMPSVGPHLAGCQVPGTHAHISTGSPRQGKDEEPPPVIDIPQANAPEAAGAQDVQGDTVTNGPLTDPTVVRRGQALGVRHQGSLRNIAAQLRVYSPYFGWTVNCDDAIELELPGVYPWESSLCLKMGVSKVEMEAVKWWLETTRFSPPHGEPGRKGSSRSRMATFAEMAIALEADTAIQLGGAKTDLARKIDFLRAAIRYLMKHCNPRTLKKTRRGKVSFDSFFLPKKNAGSLEPLTGTRLAGIGRRIQWRQGDAALDFIAAHAYRAQATWGALEQQTKDDTVSGLHNRAPPFGTKYNIHDDHAMVKPARRPDALLACESEIATAHEDGKTPSGGCFFGCNNRAKLRTQNMVPMWRGAALGNSICTSCYYRIISELRESSVPLITEEGKSPNQMPRLQGPCLFGCKTSAFDNSFKKRMQWHSAPQGCQ